MSSGGGGIARESDLYSGSSSDDVDECSASLRACAAAKLAAREVARADDVFDGLVARRRDVVREISMSGRHPRAIHTGVARRRRVRSSALKVRFFDKTLADSGDVIGSRRRWNLGLDRRDTVVRA